MMATDEHSSAKLKDTPTSCESTSSLTHRFLSQAYKTHPDSLVCSTVNGNLLAQDDITKKRFPSVDEQINPADISISGGLDTDISRADWTSQKDDTKRHTRTGQTIRKQATFKAVSVNKTFLASKSSPSGTTTKSSDKSITSTTNTQLGSLITSSSRPRLVAKSGNGAKDPTPRLKSVVNGEITTTVPNPSGVWNKNRPPESKKLTDEELRKYGIHMANRLNEDETQGQKKWADIDDDDDDWTPEAITWGDGTKTTLPHPDEQIAASLEIEGNEPAIPKHKIEAKPRSPALTTEPTYSALARCNSMAPGKGLILKSAALDKPALVAKPPAPPTPAKSPWAILPPIDRASPASAEELFVGRGPSKEKLKIAPSHPKEIAADDFSRSSWRDGMSKDGKELFNSLSGCYEPVSSRRNLILLDSVAKKPALLHRSQAADLSSESSNVLQTNHTPEEESLGPRRECSHTSSGSGPFTHQHDKTSERPALSVTEQFGAQKPPSLDRPNESFSIPEVPNVHRHAISRPQTSQSRVSQTEPGTASVAPDTSAPGTSTPAQETKMEKFAPIEPTVNDVEYQKTLMRERIELARKRRQEEEAREEAAKRERIQKKLDALGPAPDKRSDKKTSLLGDTLQPTHIKQRNIPEPSQVPNHADGQECRTGPDTKNLNLPDAPGILGKTITAANEVSTSISGPRRHSHGQGGSRTDPWAGPGPRPERFTSWAAGGPPTSRNVWGSPDNDRGLGNGTFNPDLGRVSGTAVAPQQNPKSLSPIAPPNNTTRGPQQGQSQPPQLIDYQRFRCGAQSSDLANKWVAAVTDGDKKLSAARLLARNGRERQLAEQGLSAEDTQPIIKETWRPIQLPGDGTRRVVGIAEVQSRVTEPWKTPQDKHVKRMTANEDSCSSASASIISPVGGSLLSQAGARVPQFRASRFFPSKDVRFELNFVAVEPIRPTSPSLPPPTTEGHPAYEGDAVHPHVSLPKPQSIVRLPPSRLSSSPHQLRKKMTWGQSRLPPKEIIRASSSNGPISHCESESSRGIWQERIDNLLNGGRTLPSKHVLVDAASKSSLDPQMHESRTTVFMPGTSVSTSASRASKCWATKPMAEECFEEQEMGSLPHIRLPHEVPEAAWQPALPQKKPLPRKLLIQASAIEPYSLAADAFSGGNAMKVKIPGMIEAKYLTAPFSSTRAGRSGNSTRSVPRRRNGSHGSRGNKRDTTYTVGGKSCITSSSSTRSSRSCRKKGLDSWT